jgi:hypothetical protein
MAAGDTWLLHRTNDPRFPYQITIERDGEATLRLLTKDRWPGSGRALFCVRLGPEIHAELEIEEELQRVPITALHQSGKKLSVVLDRKRFKRSDFLFVQKKLTSGESVEQIFWQSQHTGQTRRPRVKLTAQGRRRDFVIAIDSNERYAWKFPGCATERRSLPVGDYALCDGDDLVAIVERKSFDNMLAELGKLNVFHQSLAELAQVEQHALVVEAPYADFLKPKKVHHFSPTFCAKAIAEIHASHPTLRVVFVESRKLAIEWTLRFFAAIWDRRGDRGQLSLLE